MSRVQLIATILVVAALAPLPIALAQHCETGLHAFARNSLTPQSSPPHVTNAPGACPRTFGLTDTHEFSATSDQLFVRCYCGMSPRVTSTFIQLDGLGWEGQLFRLYRIERPTGPSYELDSWLYFPDGTDAEGPLTITFMEPGYAARVEYWKAPAPLGAPS